MTEKMLVFDMDGTIADLYAVENWLPMLRAYDVTPYEKARPMYDMNELADVLNALKRNGYTIAIVTWLAKGNNKEYDNKVRVAKANWIKRYGFPVDEVHMVKYGTTKANCVRKKTVTAILVDDNAQIRKGWHLGDTINANENILIELKKLLDK